MSIIYTEPNMVNCIQGLPEDVATAFKKLLESGLYVLGINKDLTWSCQDLSWDAQDQVDDLLETIPRDALFEYDLGLAKMFETELNKLSELQMILHRKAVLRDDLKAVLDEEMKQYPHVNIYNW